MATITDEGGLVGRYAAALHELAEAHGRLDAVAADLRRLNDAIAASPDLAAAMASPVIAPPDKGRALAAIAERMGLDDLARRFIGVVAANGRAGQIRRLIDGFLAFLAKRRGEVAAEVASAEPLSADQVARIADQLRRRHGAKLTVHAKVDPALIGGLVVRVGSILIDNSVKTKLLRLQQAMKGAA